MADIDQIIAGGAGASSRADFSGLADISKAYWEGLDQRAKNDVRDAFKNGNLPLTPDGKDIDWGAAAKTLIQKGGFEQGVQAANLGIAQSNQRFGQDQSNSIRRFDGGQPPDQQPTIVSPPSSNRGASTLVAPPLNRGGIVRQNGDQSQGQETPTSFLQKQGIQPGYNLEVGLAAFKRNGIEPDQPFNPNDPEFSAKFGPLVQRLKSVGQVQPPQPGDNPPAQQPPMQPGPQIAQAPPQPGPQGQPQPITIRPQTPQMQARPVIQQPNVQQPPGPQIVQAQPQGQPGPVTNAITTTQAPPTPSRTDQAIAFFSGIMSDPRSPKQNVELAKTRLEALQKNSELTPLQKEYSQAVLQGFKGTMQDYSNETEGGKTAATEEAKLGATKYQTLVDSGIKAQQEIPQLELLQNQMNDPNFFSGAGEKYNLLYKRLKSAVGIDPDAAVPQELLRKVMAANILGSLGSLKGLGQIRVAEIKMAQQAAAAPDNSIPANKLLVEISKRTHERNADIADMAQSYKQQNGTLDPGFDKQVTAYYRQHPLFSDAEIKDFHKVIGEAPQASIAPRGGPQSSSQFAPVPNARRAPDGNWYVPDPSRGPNKYLRVN